MIYFLFALTGMLLVLMQSLILVVVLPEALVYDLLIPLVVFLSLFYPGGKSLLLILFLGLIMDGITGGALGIYMLTYFWVFVAIQLAVHFFQKDSPVLMVTAIVLGVALEYGLFMIVASFSGKGLMAEADMSGAMIGRLITAGFTGPILLTVLKTFYNGMTPDPNIS